MFELLILEGAQAGLSWSTVLKKREHYRFVFDDFNPERIARYDEQKVAELLADPGIIRNRAWIEHLIMLLALPQYGLSTVPVISFVSATLLPLGSEPVVFGLV